jgi:hypothetical protein
MVGMRELQVSSSVNIDALNGRTTQNYSTGTGSTKFRIGRQYYYKLSRITLGNNFDSSGLHPRITYPAY